MGKARWLMWGMLWVGTSGFWWVVQRNCSAIDIGTAPGASDFVRSGTQLAGHPQFGEREDNFAIYTRTESTTPFHYIYLRFLPANSLTLSNFRHVILNSSHSVWIFNTSCKPHVSINVSMSINVFAMGCRGYEMSWVKVCGSGVPNHREGMTVLYKHLGRLHPVVTNGRVADPNFAENSKERVAVSLHTPRVEFVLRQLPVLTGPIVLNITHESNIGEILQQYLLHLRVDSLEYDPPFLIYDEAIVYPTIKGSAASRGSLSVHSAHDLEVEFNCLGIEQRTTVILQIDVPLFQPVKLYIDKECSRETLLDRIEEAIEVEEEKYGVLSWLLVLFLTLALVFALVTICGLVSGKSCADSVPCCKSCARKMCGTQETEEAPNSPQQVQTESTELGQVPSSSSYGSVN